MSQKNTKQWKAIHEKGMKDPEDTSSRSSLAKPSTEVHLDEWSDWIWDDYSRIYYRGKRGFDGVQLFNTEWAQTFTKRQLGVWKYEYAEIKPYLGVKGITVPHYCRFFNREYVIEKQKVVFQKPPAYALKEKDGVYVLAVGEDESPTLTGNEKAEVSDIKYNDEEESGNQKAEKLEGDSTETLPIEQGKLSKSVKERRLKRRRGRSRGPKTLRRSFELLEPSNSI